jgi:hypothetical protein
MYTLDFRSRVTTASVKNFLLERYVKNFLLEKVLVLEWGVKVES